MPRNGAGTATPPAGNPVVAGTTINTTWGNNTVNDIYNELSNSIAKDGQTVITANLPMAGYRLTGVGDALALTQNPSVKQMQNQAATYVSTVGGTADAVTLTPAFLPTAYTAGQRYTFKPASSNTGAATVNVNSLGAKSIKRPDGSALSAGDLTAAGMADITYDGTNFVLSIGQGAAGNLISTAIAAHVATSSPTTDHSKDPHGDRAYSDYKGVDVRTYGGTSGGSTAANTTAFNAAVAAAQANGSNRIYIPFDSWTVTSNTDAAGCVVVGNGTTELTNIIGASKFDSCVIAGINQDYMAVHPVIPFDSTPKLIKMHDAHTMRIIVQKPTAGYTWVTLEDNVTTGGDDSLALTNSDTTMWRVTSILDSVECLCGITTQTDSNGTWNVVTMGTDVPAYDGGSPYLYLRSTDIGAWSQYQITVPEDGYLSVTFVESIAASSDVTITMARTSAGAGGSGNLVAPVTTLDANFTTVATTAARVTREYNVKPGVWVIRITNNTAGSTGLGIAGIYFSKLKNARNDIAYDMYGVYRNDATYINPIMRDSANDMVLKDNGSVDNGSVGIYGGSYHGGESAIASVLYVDGVSKTIASGNIFVGTGIELQQNCTITWAGSKPGCTYSGATVEVHTRTIALIGGYAQSASVTGDLTARELYTTLFGVNENYDAITIPQYKVLTSITDGAYYPVGQNNAVEYYYASTGQRLKITHTAFTCPDSARGGSYIWRVSGVYCKYYSPWVWHGKRDITSISSINILQAS